MPMVKQPLTIEHALLGFVRRAPMHGYEIHQRLLASRELGLVWNIRQSLLYGVLKRLEDEGYLTSMLEHQARKPARKQLHLTDAGRVVFATWVQTPVQHGRDFRVEFLAKLYFAREDGGNAVHELVERQRHATRFWLADLQDQANTLHAEGSYDWLVLRFRIGQLQAILEWLDLCETWAMQTPTLHGSAG